MTNAAYVRCDYGIKLFAGSKVVTVLAASDSVKVWSGSSFKEKFGRDFDAGGGDGAVFMNGDGKANSVHVDGSTYDSGDLYAILSSASGASASLRLNYLVWLNG